MAIGKIDGQEVRAEELAAVPVAAQVHVGSGPIDSAGIHSAGIAVEAVQPLETSVAMYYMFAAADTAAADTELSTADSAAASPSTAPVIARSETAEKYAAAGSADIPAVVAATYSDT